MKKVIIYLLITGISFGISLGLVVLGEICSSDSIELYDITSVTYKFEEALHHKNTEVLQDILADKIRLNLRLEKSEVSKEEFLTKIKDSKGITSHFNIGDIKTKIDGNKAIVTYDLVSSIESTNGKIIRHNAQYTHLYEKQHGRWKLVYIQQK